MKAINLFGFRIEYYPKDGKYEYDKRVFWYWNYYHLPYFRKHRLDTPIGGFNFYY